LATEDVQELLLAALKGLNDVENTSASADCVMLNSTLPPLSAIIVIRVIDHAD
jgi:hypothetical protein